ncbi:phenylacetate--CoA ligase family protein [Paenibacillus sp. S28]|uniref:phenylacetate--CoA ligase family protein n=1 Tax=Paenibacillus sp. S28 TaxID=2767463 RepID=UPI00190CBAE2|nr:phenylacetate--CoA ligase family protein [Paenibacillus sp. S28]MBJ9991088.1 phenylacetate--CoA ligase family protein [Paenibacillus sp. S28]
MGMTREVAKRILSYLPYRYVNVGREFHLWLHKFEQTMQMSPGEIRAAQLETLKRMVTLAYEETVFYKQLYDKQGFHPSMLQDAGDIARIPVIRKEDIRSHGEDMIVNRCRGRKLKKLGTSGTTGVSLTLYSNRTVEQREWAAICFLWARVGYKPGEGRVEFRGALPDHQVYRLDRYSRTLKINTTAIHERNVPEIVQAIRDTGYRYLYGFPSAIALFAKLAVQAGKQHEVKPKAILLACEMVHDYQVHFIHNVFHEAQLFAHYGQTEKAALAGWLDETRAYYFLPLYSYVEQNPDNGAIIGTSLLNDVMPLIRYELTDAASPLIEEPRSGADHLFPVIDTIDGRMGEIMYKPNGDMLPSPLMAIALRGTTTFSACKLIQHNYDHIEILVESSLPEEAVRPDIAMMIGKLQSLFTPAMHFTSSIVTYIPRSATGKFKNVEVRIGEGQVTL